MDKNNRHSHEPASPRPVIIIIDDSLKQLGPLGHWMHQPL
jgi:hypothetical protein